MHFGDDLVDIDLLEIVFSRLELDWQKYVDIDQRYFRPAEVDLLLGDPSKAKRVLNWQATTNLEQLAELMVDHDLDLAQRELHNATFAT